MILSVISFTIIASKFIIDVTYQLLNLDVTIPLEGSEINKDFSDLFNISTSKSQIISSSNPKKPIFNYNFVSEFYTNGKRMANYLTNSSTLYLDNLQNLKLRDIDHLNMILKNSELSYINTGNSHDNPITIEYSDDIKNYIEFLINTLCKSELILNYDNKINPTIINHIRGAVSYQNYLNTIKNLSNKNKINRISDFNDGIKLQNVDISFFNIIFVKTNRKYKRIRTIDVQTN